MSEINQMGCEEFTDVAAELALGVLTGRERAQALAHLDQCDACREHVSQLTSAGEQLLALLPTSEPPPGFETRVMERIGLPAPAPDPVAGSRARRRRPRPWLKISRTRGLLAVAAVLAAIVAGGVGGWGLHGTGTQVAGAPLSHAVFLSASHQSAGKIFVYDGNPGWLYMSVDVTPTRGHVICQIMGRDGRVTTVGTFWLANGYGSWGSAVPAGTGPVAGARLLRDDGTVLATATFAAH
jgi:anti-sigma-K factor RskA